MQDRQVESIRSTQASVKRSGLLPYYVKFPVSAGHSNKMFQEKEGRRRQREGRRKSVQGGYQSLVLGSEDLRRREREGRTRSDEILTHLRIIQLFVDQMEAQRGSKGRGALNSVIDTAYHKVT